MPKRCVRPGCPRANSQEIIKDSGVIFCPDCGNRLEQFPIGPGPVVDGGTTQAAHPPASKGQRAGAFLLDLLLSFILGSVALVPIVGQFPATFLLTLFWLFRDVKGASPGKMLLGISVANRSGGPSTTRQRIVRNLPFALSILPLIIPGLGYLVAVLLESCAYLIEALGLLFTGARLADGLAGTSVVRGEATRAAAD